MSEANIVRKPSWLKVPLGSGERYRFLKHLVRSETLHTVCEEARCPNIGECWGRYRTASFMILGDTCTRHCRFCAIKTGLPGEVDPSEPLRVASAVRKMGLEHVHVTMVNRDDLPDGGASIMAATVKTIKKLNPKTSVEVLCSDFLGRSESIRKVAESRPDIFSHNVETVRRLTPLVRSRSDYFRSLEVLRAAKAFDSTSKTKSSIMVGLGETREEISEVMDDLRARSVDMLNIGQYLQASKSRVAVKRYWHPEEFAALRQLALEKGFVHCESGPLVRSSYHANEQYQAVRNSKATTY